jgi:EmrB/QacA subfamily drug resistance transporter
VTSSTQEPAVTGAQVGFRSDRGPVLIALMLSIALVALDSTILATAVPSIVGDLGGFASFPWLFSAYLLTQAVSVPLYGKLADMRGRRPLMVLGVIVFLVGSLICLLAPSMGVLIVGRLVQGLGAGAIQPISMTIAGDIYTIAERAKAQGYLASVWGLASVLGPALGGVFSQFVSWRWIFAINFPVGALALVMLLRGLKENVEHERHRVDYAGAAAVAVAGGALLLGLLQGGVSWAWTSGQSLMLGAVAVAAVATFVFVERRAAEPVLGLWVFRNRMLSASCVVSLAVGALVVGLTSFVPSFVEYVLHRTPIVAGFTVATLSLGWPIAASQAGRLYLRIGFRNTSLIGAALSLVAAVGMVRVTDHSTLAWVASSCFVLGVGMGLVASPTVVAMQSVVGWARRGVVTGAAMFARSTGSAVGAALFGAVANAGLVHALAAAPGPAGAMPATADEAGAVLQHPGSLPADVIESVRLGFASAVHNVFVAALAGAALLCVSLLVVPRRPTPLDEDSELHGPT